MISASAACYFMISLPMGVYNVTCLMFKSALTVAYTSGRQLEDATFKIRRLLIFSNMQRGKANR